MHIFYVTQCGFERPSAETVHALEIIRSFSKLGHKVSVLFPGTVMPHVDDISCYSINIDINRTLNKFFFQLWVIYTLLRTRDRFDLIYARHAAIMFGPCLVGFFRRGPVISEYNTLFHNKETTSNPLLLFLIGAIERFTVTYSNRVVVVTDFLKECLIHKYPKLADKALVVENGANLNVMKPLNKQHCREKFNISSDKFVIGFVGHLHPWQGIDTIIKASKVLSESSNEFVFVIAGTGTELESYKKECCQQDLLHTTIFLGAVSFQSVPEIISACDVCIAPGSSENFFNYKIRSPIKVYEYLACGRPVISGELPVLKNYFLSHDIGFLIKPGDHQELAEAIRFFADNRVVLERFGANARKLALTSFSWDVAAAKILSNLQ